MAASDSKQEIKEKRIPRGEAPFSVMARVTMQLGRESISNSITAISELVKNAYDADAETVKIRFAGLETEHPILLIEDDGNGMTEQQLRNQWMVIGTPNKLLSARSSRKKRILTGEKGIGRLGLDRLSSQTIIQTFSEKEEGGTELVIDWRKYENTNERLERITHQLYSIAKIVQDPISKAPSNMKKGTRLILYDLKNKWDKAYLLELKQELRLLVSPFAGINDFSIEICSGMNWSEVDGQVGSAYMLQAAEWKLEAEIDDEGDVSYIMSSNQHEEVFKLDPTAWEKRPQCGPVKFEMYFFARRKVNVDDITFSRTQIAQFMNSNQGIRIYRDGFRVNPYGEPNGSGDWLNLSYRRQQSPQGVRQPPRGGWRVGYNQVVGAVFISRDKNMNLIDQTNRESIVQGPAFYDLKRWALEGVRFFEINRHDFELARQEPADYEKVRQEVEISSQASQAAIENLKSTTEKIKKLLENRAPGTATPDSKKIQNLLDEAVKEVDQRVSSEQKAQQAFAKVADEREEEVQRQKDTLGNLASLGILSTSFGHETLGASNLVMANARQLKRNLDAGLFMVLPNVLADVEDNLAIIMHQSAKIETFAKFTLRNMGRDKRTRKKVRLNQVARQVFRFFQDSLSKKNITVELELPAQISPIRAFQIDWESIFVNLITNSVWAMEDTEHNKRKMRVSMQEVDQHIQITFADSGIGIERGTVNNIFMPTFSTKRNKKGEVVGTGMGLAIVKDFVESYDGGTIEVESPCDLGGAQFHIRVRVPNLNTQKEQ